MALEGSGDRFRVSGFGTLALTRGGTDELGFRANLSQDGVYDEWTLQTDSVLGLQIDAALSDKLSGTLQLVAKDRPHNGLEKSIEWAYLAYDFSPAWELRVGRLGVDFLGLGEFRHVGFASNWVRPPVDYYGFIPVNAFDGFDLSYNYRLPKGRLLSKIYWGISDNTYVSDGGDHNFDLDPSYGVSFRYQLDQLELIAAYSHNEIENYEYDRLDQLSSLLYALPAASGGAEVAELLALDGAEADYYSLGAEYRTGPWKMTGELAYMDSTGELWRPFVGGYVSLSRRFDDVAVFGLVSHARTTGEITQIDAPLVPAPLTTLAQAGLAAADSNQKTFSLGARWDLRSNVALKAQWDRTWVEENKGLAWERRRDEVAEQSVDTITLTMDFLF